MWHCVPKETCDWYKSALSKYVQLYFNLNLITYNNLFCCFQKQLLFHKGNRSNWLDPLSNKWKFFQCPLSNITFYLMCTIQWEDAIKKEIRMWAKALFTPDVKMQFGWLDHKGGMFLFTPALLIHLFFPLWVYGWDFSDLSSSWSFEHCNA